MELINLLTDAVNDHASDIFIVAGRPYSYKKNGEIVKYSDRLMPDDTNRLIQEIYRLASNREMQYFLQHGDDDFSFALPGLARFRVSTYKQRGSCAAVIRVINFTLPDPAVLEIPERILSLGELQKGMVLVTGPAGSGKSTTLACIIDYINCHKDYHIITLEDPLEFLHSHKNSIVSQREISADTDSYITALRASLRQSPDVILLGEMRDYETIDVAMTAAETGHLIFSTLHTLGAAKTIDRIIDVFPANQQHQIALRLSMTLQAVVSQQLVPDVNGNRIPAFEIMMLTPAIRNMIRDGKIPQIEGLLSGASTADMLSMDQSLIDLYRAGRITKDTAYSYAFHQESMKRKLELF
ncbi:MAG: PilT/PilU family type 4a pilus ATPase [Lachnospiraceae bacterium]|nr:PilT/PilU family type 4a pilus ATPase [Lachnospiraceae bacterium]